MSAPTRHRDRQRRSAAEAGRPADAAASGTSWRLARRGFAGGGSEQNKQDTKVRDTKADAEGGQAKADQQPRHQARTTKPDSGDQQQGDQQGNQQEPRRRRRRRPSGPSRPPVPRPQAPRRTRRRRAVATARPNCARTTSSSRSPASSTCSTTTRSSAPPATCAGPERRLRVDEHGAQERPAPRRRRDRCGPGARRMASSPTSGRSSTRWCASTPSTAARSRTPRSVRTSPS